MQHSMSPGLVAFQRQTTMSCSCTFMVYSSHLIVSDTCSHLFLSCRRRGHASYLSGPLFTSIAVISFSPYRCSFTRQCVLGRSVQCSSYVGRVVRSLGSSVVSSVYGSVNGSLEGECSLPSGYSSLTEALALTRPAPIVQLRC